MLAQQVQPSWVRRLVAARWRLLASLVPIAAIFGAAVLSAAAQGAGAKTAYRLGSGDKIKVSIEVLNLVPFGIIGEVEEPGSNPYRSGMTVINAVAVAGGFTYRAEENGFRVKRGGNAQTETTQRNSAVFPGDVIEILERWFQRN